VIDSPTADTGTAVALLATLREATGDGALSFAQPPVALSGGYYAEILGFRLADPPAGLAGGLVARIVPDAAIGEWESTIQRAVAGQGFPTPAVRLTVPATSPLGRYLIVMDRVDGRPPIGGLDLDLVSTFRQVPTLLRRMPEHLAGVAAQLHALDPGPLAAQLEGLGGGVPTTVAAFVRREVELASAVDRTDLADAGERLLATEPLSPHRVIAHGDLHPFNLLMTRHGAVLVDWTVALVADPAFTLAFTDLMLSHPPVPMPRGGATVLRPLGRSMAKRFLACYRAQVPAAGQVDAERLDWHRRVHALRILVELAAWDQAGTRPAEHPWLVLEPVVRRLLGLRPRR
jgi:aminoglycoside phosphotransferase (APT) family kinase protein